MARHTKQPEVLRELFEALGNDPFVIAECLARPVLTERLVAELSAHDKGQRFAMLRSCKPPASKSSSHNVQDNATYTLPEIDPCTDDTWTVQPAPSTRPRRELSHGSVDRQRNDRLGRRYRQRLFEHWREIQSQHRQLDSHQHHQRARCPSAITQQSGPAVK